MWTDAIEARGATRPVASHGAVHDRRLSHFTTPPSTTPSLICRTARRCYTISDDGFVQADGATRPVENCTALRTTDCAMQFYGLMASSDPRSKCTALRTIGE